MTANLLAHSDLFEPASRRSGAYNRRYAFWFSERAANDLGSSELYIKVSPL